ncbi:molybdopterin-dependent oxidoreductase [Candidatus Oleimmundimicrobium sp.]|uniref:molybdopterin-dependent oxidoreductase n=1 Tax=Candidatus Oleimmundimicrobium sp. TaxID=3060597 RepID=UPI0027204716|nr:molybdopterin-dependent oxidoreductase [Candidatus Oleimmundimicrobium sp.]MDO8886258.1 molybdopterin-dependent oxidoreductase [Candidatus Oleimmundimicrobium sp.]
MSEQVTVTINGKEVKVPEGVFIIQAAKMAGIDIPHLCYCECLPSTGSCRVCLVEVEGIKGLVASCARKVKDGMVIATDTEKIREARRFVLELILSNHPGDCMSCDKNGACELQKYAYELGIEKTSFLMKDPGYEIDKSNPFIERNYNLCILCGRCVGICKTQGADIIDFIKRGMITKVATPLDKPLQESGCDFCGSCLAVCPVGALLEVDRRFRGREWEMKETRTVCSYCGCGCDLVFGIVDGQIMRATGEGLGDFLCARGRFGWDFVESPKRITKPLIKKDGVLTESTYEEAFGFVAERLLDIKKAHGADSVGGFIGAGNTNEVAYLFQKFLRAGIGTNNIDSSARLLGFPALVDLYEALGDGAVVSMKDVEEADALLLVNADVTVAYPRVGVAVKRALSSGAKLVTIDARRTKISEKADIYIQSKVGSDEFVLSGLLKELLDGKIYDEEFAKKCEKFEDLKKSLGKLKMETVERESGISKDVLKEAAKLYSEGKKAVIIFGAETASPQTMELIADISLLTGRTRASVLPCLLSSNLRGTVYMGALAEFYPGVRKIDEARNDFEKTWGVKLPKKAGLSIKEMLDGMGSSILGMYIVGADPVTQFPNSSSVAKSLSSLDFLVVQDTFLTETAKLADVVLPGITLAESNGTIVNMEYRTKEVRAVIEPLAETDWKTVTALSKRMNYTMGYSSEKEIAKEIKSLVFVPKKIERDTYSFILVEPKVSGEEPDKKYPYTLIVGETTFGFYDGVRTKISKLSELEPNMGDYVIFNSDDAAFLGLEDGCKVTVKSRRGKVTTSARILDFLPKGMFFMPSCHHKQGVLASDSIDLKLKSPQDQLIAVSVSKEGVAK